MPIMTCQEKVLELSWKVFPKKTVFVVVVVFKQSNQNTTVHFRL